MISYKCMVSTGHHMLQMPLVTLVDHTQNVKAFGKGIAEFAGLKVVDLVVWMIAS